MIKKVWITKWALTEGLFEAEVEINDSFPTMAKHNPEESKYPVTLHRNPAKGKGDWWFQEEKDKAIAHCEKIRLKKIASLEKQLKHLNGVSFQ